MMVSMGATTDLPERVLRVFVSSTSEDLAEHRQAVIAALSSIERIKPVNQETFGSLSAPTVDECRRLVRDSDLVVVIVAHRYGWVPAADEGGDGEASITELEVRAAMEAGRPLLGFLVDESDDHHWSGTREQDAIVDADLDQVVEIKRRVDRLKDFKQRLSQQIRSTFTTPDSLAATVATSLANEIERVDRREASSLARVGAPAGAPAGDAPRNGLGVDGGFRDPYHTRLEAFRRLHNELRGRDDELTTLSSLVERGGYQVILGGPWTGKTALMVHLAQRLRDLESTVIEYFVAEKRADTDRHYLPFVITQLLDATGSPGGVAADHATQLIQLRALWAYALESIPGRVVLLVDGLDEQDGNDPISPLLPTVCPDNASIVVSSRPHPDPALTVGAEHGLARAAGDRRFELTPYEGARDIERAARGVVRQMLADPLTRDLIGLLTYARGPLSADELADLSDRFPADVEDSLAPLLNHLRATEDEVGVVRYEFGHQTLQAQAEAGLGAKGHRTYRSSIQAWAQRYADAGWPADTPAYLVSSLDDFVLADATGADRTEALRWLSTDARAALLRSRLGHVTATLDAMGELIHTQPPLPFAERFQLAAREVELRAQSSTIPDMLLPALARTGHVDIALDIARGIANDETRGAALYEVVRTMATEAPRLAVEIANSITTDGHRARALAHVGVETGSSELIEQALAVVRSTIDSDHRSSLIEAVAGPVARFDVDLALELAGESVDDEYANAAALSAIGAVLAETDVERALELARDIEFEWRRAGVLIASAKVLAATDPTRAADLAREVPVDWGRIGLLAALARTTGREELLDEACSIVHAAPERAARDDALADLAVARAGDDVDDAVRLAEEMSDPLYGVATLAEIATKAATTDVERALAIARSIDVEGARTQALAGIALERAESDIAIEALEVSRAIRETRWLNEARLELVTELVPTDHDRALAIARRIEDQATRVRALATLGAQVRSADILAEAAELIPLLDEDWERQWVLREVAPLLATTDVELAIALAETITDDFDRVQVFIPLAAAVAVSDTARAVDIAERLVNPWERNEAFAAAAARVASIDADVALDIATHIDEYQRTTALVGIVEAITATDPKRGLEIARTIDDASERGRALASVAAATDDDDLAAEAVEVARTAYDFMVASGLARVARTLGRDDLAREALDLAEAIDSLASRTSVLREIAPTLAGTDPDLAIDVAQRSGIWRDDALSDITLALAEDDPDRALDVARVIADDGRRARTLVLLARARGDRRASLIEWLLERWTS